MTLNDSYNLLKTIRFADIKTWDVKKYLNNSSIFKNDIRITNYNNIVSTAVIEKVHIKDIEAYPILGVRSYGNGAYINRVSSGKDLKMRIYQKAKSNHLFWCKVDTKNGAFGIIDEKLSIGYASSNMSFAEINTDKIVPEFLQLVFKSKIYNQYMDSFITGTTNRKYILFDTLLEEVQIPLPLPKEQIEIVKKYNNKINEANLLDEKAESLSSSVEEYLLGELGVNLNNEESTKGLNFVNFSNTNRWGVEYLLMKNHSPFSKSKYEQVDLSAVVDINPRTNFDDIKEKQISFIPMECVSDEYGEIIEYRVGEVKSSKGYTKFKEGDLIWAKITPCMQNGKSALAENLLNNYGYGSTEFYVFRQSSNALSLKYLHNLFRLPYFLNVAKKYFSGSAGQQRVPINFFKTLQIPLPSLAEQNKLVSHIEIIKSELKAIKRKANKLREQAITEFEKELFVS